MAHHAYFAAGERTAAAASARAFIERELGESAGSLDIIQFSFELFSIEDARRLIDAASVSGLGNKKVIIASMTRVFHEAQNALLKIVEEPPEGTVIILCVPSEGVLIPTLRSRLLSIPMNGADALRASAPVTEGISARFLSASASEREKIIGSLLDQAKADKDEIKQQARREAIELVQGLTEAAHAKLRSAKTASAKEDARQMLEDLTAFTPILYERSAPLKPIFEHLLLVIPKELELGGV